MYYTLANIARMLSASPYGRFVTEDKVRRWVKEGLLEVERVPEYVQGWGKYPYWVEENHLKAFLQEKGYDVTSLFPTS